MANLIGNPSFETDLTGWFQTGSTSDTLARESGPLTAFDGTWYASNLFAGVGNHNLDYAGVPVTPGQFYSYGIYARWKTGATPRQVRIDVRWFDSTGTSFNTNTGSNTTINTSTWTQITRLNIQAPSIANGQTADAVTTALRVLCQSGIAAEAVAYDAAQINAGSTLESLNPPLIWTVSKLVKFG